MDTKLMKVVTDWQLEEMMIAAAAVRMPDYDDGGIPFVSGGTLHDIDNALVLANREIKRLKEENRRLSEGANFVL